jgi:threonine/homoserine/homoserine lactone efflux protein
METVDIFSIIKDVVLGISAVAVAFLAWLGLQTWRRELTGEERNTPRNKFLLFTVSVYNLFRDCFRAYVTYILIVCSATTI